jgi:hypothetical protein
MNNQTAIITFLSVDWEIEFTYYAGTNHIITSASLEPNDDPEIEVISIKQVDCEMPEDFLVEFLVKHYDEIEKLAWELDYL